MKRNDKPYWACQIAGWGAYSAVGFTTAVLDTGWRPSIVVGWLLFLLYSIGLTHLLRGEFHRRNWAALPIPPALARLAAASVVIGAVQSSLVVGVYTAIEGRLGVWSQWSSIVFMFMGVSIVTTIWTVLYLTITTWRHAREVSQNEVRMKLALGEAELRTLEAQLNPHFLFGSAQESDEHQSGRALTAVPFLGWNNPAGFRRPSTRHPLLELGFGFEVVIKARRVKNRFHVRLQGGELRLIEAVAIIQQRIIGSRTDDSSQVCNRDTSYVDLAFSVVIAVLELGDHSPNWMLHVDHTLRRFLEDHKFSLGRRHALGLQQEVAEVLVTAAAAQQ